MLGASRRGRRPFQPTALGIVSDNFRHRTGFLWSSETGIPLVVAVRMPRDPCFDLALEVRCNWYEIITLVCFRVADPIIPF